jgi:hypothetical protein
MKSPEKALNFCGRFPDRQRSTYLSMHIGYQGCAAQI